MILYIILSVLCILLLTNYKNYWQSDQFLRFQLTREVVIIILCVGLSYTSIELHRAKEIRHIPFEVGTLDHEDIQRINLLDRSSAGQWDVEAKEYGRVIKNVAVYLIPISLFFFRGSIKRRLILFLIFTQGYILTESLTGTAKGLVDRFRPFVYLNQKTMEKLNPDSKAELMEDIAAYDIQNSFFSGDASITAYGLIFFAACFNLFYSQSNFRNFIWIFSIVGIILECYFRVQSGKHFPSDVLVGSLLGGLMAFSIVCIHKDASTKL